MHGVWLFHPNRFVNKWWMGPTGYCCFQEACRPSINQALSAVYGNSATYIRRYVATQLAISKLPLKLMTTACINALNASIPIHSK